MGLPGRPVPPPPSPLWPAIMGSSPRCGPGRSSVEPFFCKLALIEFSFFFFFPFSPPPRYLPGHGISLPSSSSENGRAPRGRLSVLALPSSKIDYAWRRPQFGLEIWNCVDDERAVAQNDRALFPPQVLAGGATRGLAPAPNKPLRLASLRTHWKLKWKSRARPFISSPLAGPRLPARASPAFPPRRTRITRPRRTFSGVE